MWPCDQIWPSVMWPCGQIRPSVMWPCSQIGPSVMWPCGQIRPSVAVNDFLLTIFTSHSLAIIHGHMTHASVNIANNSEGMPFIVKLVYHKIFTGHWNVSYAVVGDCETIGLSLDVTCQLFIICWTSFLLLVFYSAVQRDWASSHVSEFRVSTHECMWAQPEKVLHTSTVCS